MSDPDTAAPFLSIPWCAALLNAPNTTLYVPTSRTIKPDKEDTLFAETLKTTRTLSSVQSFHPTPSPDDPTIPKISTLIKCGDGVNGHPGILHGGVVAVVLDETMGMLWCANDERLLRAGKEGKGAAFTVDLRIEYKRPVFTPGVMLARTETVKVEGRKEWLRSVILQRDGETGKEVVCAVGTGLFVRAKVPKGSSRL